MQINNKPQNNATTQNAAPGVSPMDEYRIRQIIRDEIERNYRAGSPIIPPHTHNGNDNLQINLSNLVGTNPVPYSNTKFSTPFLNEDYGYAAPAILGSTAIVVNNMDSSFNFNTNSLLSTVPIPIIYGVSGAGFAQANAQVGTVVGFQNPDAGVVQLWVMFADGWYGVDLDLF